LTFKILFINIYLSVKLIEITLFFTTSIMQNYFITIKMFKD